MENNDQPPKLPTEPSPPVSPHVKKPTIDPEFTPMEGEGFSHILNHLLKRPMAIVYEIKNGNQSPLIALLIIALVCLGVFGLVLGMFSAGDQLWAAPVKVIGGCFFSALICLPSLYIFGCLSGMEVRIQHTAGLMLALLAITSLLLVGFAPVAWLFSTSSNSLAFFGFLSLAIWFVCLIFGLRVITRASKNLGGRSGGHLYLWAIIFCLVTVQMTTTLRPIIGTSENFLNLKEKKFFLVHWFEVMDGEENSSIDEHDELRGTSITPNDEATPEKPSAKTNPYLKVNE